MSRAITQSTRHRVCGNYRGPHGSWEINDWLSAERCACAVLRACGDKRNELVRVITESRLPSGRWGRRTVANYPVAA